MMAAVTTVAAGMAVLLCIVLSRPCTEKHGEEDGDEKGIAGGRITIEQRKGAAEMERRLSWCPAEAPSTWQEAMAMVAQTICFTYSETLRKWPIGDLAFGIKLHMRRQVCRSWPKVVEVEVDGGRIDVDG
ncbi:hypothetical protein KSP40_PGU017250 [Platanthera guangdongensis]|uniref:Mono-/di-acylglycerol lipase N-terminal domain-containing protein n=1 Tax=Platanthera guangdongensis TaxID=2320717 RepID=A0ABR2M8T6_9ASPA